MTELPPRLKAFLALCLARLREFYREPEVVFWIFVFPLLLSVALGVAFRNRPAETSRIGVVGGDAESKVVGALEGQRGIQATRMDAGQAARALRMGRMDLVVTSDPGGSPVYRYDPSRPEAEVARARVDEALQRAAGRRDPLAARDDRVSEAGARYVDFLIPGMIGMNLMSGGLWGVGFHLVDMRIKKLLKRLLATPMRAPDFLASQMSLRLLATLVEVWLLLIFARYAFGLPIRGSWTAIAVLGLLGSASFAGMGLLVASRASKIETVTGLVNVVSMPMLIVSGVFFSAERFPAAVQPLIQALPLTALNDALRAVILEGAPLVAQGARIGLLAAWGVLCFALGLRLFRWS
jgi:ABC-2 type transport system permease protein